LKKKKIKKKKMSQEVPVRIQQGQQGQPGLQGQQGQQEFQQQLGLKNRARQGQESKTLPHRGNIWTNIFDSPIDRLMKTFLDDQYGGLNLFGDRDFGIDRTVPMLSSFKCDVIEHDNHYEIQADMPGVDKNNINISFNDSKLNIEAKRENRREQMKGGQEELILQEINYGNFCRCCYLPKSRNVDAKNIKAKYENGVLAVWVPKETKELSKKHYVQIE